MEKNGKKKKNKWLINEKKVEKHNEKRIAKKWPSWSLIQRPFQEFGKMTKFVRHPTVCPTVSYMFNSFQKSLVYVVLHNVQL